MDTGTLEYLLKLALVLQLAHNAVQQGACGVDMGRNIFQAEDPLAMIQAVRKVVHEGFKPSEANEFYLSLKKEREEQGSP